MSISAISIRNFRSILAFGDRVHDLNIFVGQNDDGKSNVLRALDLFFNHDKRHGYELDWARDYCAFAPERANKAQEITIELEVMPPRTFKNHNPVLWRKVWRKGGLHKESTKHGDGSDVRPQSKITAFLKAIRYDYVPAIKGEEYFQVLMTNLYDMLQATVEEQVREASRSFTTTINDNTKLILEAILKHLGLQTTIELPPNLRDLFAQLEFTSVSGEKPFSLRQRGDGIKVRHIPIVLRWLAEQANYLSAPGRPKAVTIWGYEEPENNLELRRCFELATEFVEGASTIQSFVTTHSPAFYSICRESDPDKVGLFLVQKQTSPPTTTIRPLAEADFDSLDSSMGLLDFLEPHFKKLRDDLHRVRTQNQLLDGSRPTMFCEGSSDKTLIEAALSALFPEMLDRVSVRSSDTSGGGHDWVGDQLVAWSLRRPTAQAVGVFDRDEGAQRTKAQLEKRVKEGGKKWVSWITLKPSAVLKDCFAKHICVPFAIEELFPEDVWHHAQEQGWLEERQNPLAIYKFDQTTITFKDHIESVLPEKHMRRLALWKVKLISKQDFVAYVVNRDAADRARVLEGLRATIMDCLDKLGLKEDLA